jgi:hypothetical protein
VSSVTLEVYLATEFTCCCNELTDSDCCCKSWLKSLTNSPGSISETPSIPFSKSSGISSRCSNTWMALLACLDISTFNVLSCNSIVLELVNACSTQANILESTLILIKDSLSSSIDLFIVFILNSKFYIN